jgi:hypothetical protein
MATTAELLEREAALEKALASGVQEVRHGERFVRYQSAGDIKTALMDVRRQLRSAPAVTDVRFSTSKGL